MRHELGVLMMMLGMTMTAGASPAVAAPTTCGGERATIVGSAADDELTGTEGRDVIAGRGGNDEILGLGGDDVLCGGDGADVLDAGDGDDVLLGGRDEVFDLDPTEDTTYFGDRLVPGLGDDMVDLGSDPRVPTYPERRPFDDWEPDELDLSAAVAGVTVDLAGGTIDGEGHDRLRPGFFIVHGSEHDDVLKGSAEADFFWGGDGADTIDGAGGHDYLGGDAGADTLRGRGGPDVILADAGADRALGGPGKDTLVGTDDDADLLQGGGGDDELYSTGGAGDRMLGGGGDDELGYLLQPGVVPVIDGGAGRNRIELQSSDPQAFPAGPDGSVDLGAGAATISWQEPTTFTVLHASRLKLSYARWTVWGTDGRDVVDGRYARSLIAHGRAGNDLLLGSNFEDELDGGAGVDTAHPGPGRDTCVSVEHTDLPRDACR